MNNKKNIYTYLITIIITLMLVTITFSSLVYLYEKRKIISNFLQQKKVLYTQTNDLDFYWSKEIMNGGYILHFRHAERDKWIDVQIYDALESDLHQNGKDNSRYAENDYFDKAVCLNERGKIQAKAMGENLKNIGLPIGPVYSSVSCRARQTAQLAFGGFVSQHRILVHGGPYKENHKTRIKLLTNFYQDLEIKKEHNTIVSSHGNVIHCDMFINDCPEDVSLDEGGFIVISQSKKGLKFEHKFYRYNHFNMNFYQR